MLRIDNDHGNPTFSSMKTLTTHLDSKKTDQLLRSAPRAFRTEINDILLTALALAYNDITGENILQIDLEGHGREDLGSTIDLSRTVGWFTTVYPVLLKVENPHDLSFSLKFIKEQLRLIPKKGIGFGILKYLSGEKLKKTSTSHINFNYLGQWSAENKKKKLFSILQTSSKWNDAQENSVSHFININCEVLDGCLKVHWNYSPSHIETATIVSFSDSFMNRLKCLVHHCCVTKEFGYTPSDFPLSLINQEKLDSVFATISQLQDVYPLSPLQEGLLFHSLFHPHSDTYFIQIGFELEGELNVSSLESIWQNVVRKHGILRTGFQWKSLDKPLQFVVQNVDLPWQVYDWQNFSEEHQNEKLHSYLENDRKHPIDIETPPLMRFALFKFSKHRFYLIWSFHHLILDGWSSALIMHEVFQNLVSKQTQPWEYVPPYKDYIAQLQQLNSENAETFWVEYLSGRATKSFCKASLQPSHHQSLVMQLSEIESDEIREFAKIHQLTLSSVIQLVWAVTLGWYFQEDDFILGITISGRSLSLPKIDQMVGLFINTLPFRFKVSWNESALTAMQKLQQDMVTLSQYSHVPLSKIQSWNETGETKSLFDHLFIFENYPFTDVIEHCPESIKIKNDRNIEYTEYPLLLSVTPSRKIGFQFVYDKNRIEEKTLQEVSTLLKNILFCFIKEPQKKILEINPLKKIQSDSLLYFKQLKDHDPCCIHDLFQKQSYKEPDRIALVWEGIHLTYSELHAKSNQLAHLLIKRGIFPERPVAICAERSLGFIIAMLAVLKAGGMYVPLDPNLPLNRLAFILQDIDAALLLVQSEYAEKMSQINHNIIVIDKCGKNICEENTIEFSLVVHPENLAYILYTSGTTGKPKGVAIQHKSVVNCIFATAKLCDIHPQDRFLAATSLSFDVAVLDYFLPFTLGCCTTIVSEETRKNPNQLISMIKEAKITCMQATPSACKMLSLAWWNSQHPIKMLIAGEKLSASITDFLLQKGKVFNIYGPTEGTIYATGKEILPNESITIGCPLENIQTIILDKHLRLKPMGSIGELYLGGRCLARGYWNKPTMTAEKFIPHPFEISSRLYQTGDVVRYFFDGMIDYIGRLDDQIKLRGFRIEIGEIESVLEEHVDVQNAVVTVKDDASGQKSLMAYIVSKEKNSDQLKNYLSTRLPDYMIPSSFVFLDKIPLSVTGKVDRKALPVLDMSKRYSENKYVAPRNDKEKILQEVWVELLGIKEISIDDNFFEIGGDSIISIQLVSKARQKGLYPEISQIFKYPTIGKLSEVLDEGQIQKKKSELKETLGEAPLTPIQHWFFEQDLFNKNHFNQSIILEIQDSVNPELMEKALQYLVDYHDAFQLKFKKIDKHWLQYYSKEPTALILEIILEDTKEIFKEKILKLESSLNIEKGPLIRAFLFKKQKKQHLCMIIHHLIVDGVSWRILIEDLEKAYLQLKQGQQISLPSKSDSYQKWSLALQNYTQSKQLKDEISYWMAQQQFISLKSKKNAFDKTTHDTTEAIQATLNEDQTEKLLQQVPKAYRTQMNDVLLTAFVIAFGNSTGDYSLYIDLEGHGRESLIDSIDHSRTVGWFTSIFPVYLQLDNPLDLSYSLKQIKEQIKKIPNKGIGFGILRYLTQQPLEKSFPPHICFNYLGQWSTKKNEKGLFKIIEGSTGSEVDFLNFRSHSISINCEIIDSCFTVNLSYSKKHDEHEAMMKVIRDFMHTLEQIIEHCCSQEKISYTPSDFPLTSLTQEELDHSFEMTNDLSTIYSLSPMQQGMLFRARLNPSSQEYFIQSSFDIESELDIPLFRAAWEKVLSNHDILRTAFVWKNLGEPVQYVLKDILLPLTFTDLSDLSEEQHSKILKSFEQQDRHNYFHLDKAPLFRLNLYKLSAQKYYLIWSCHHILLDGWSSSIIFRDFYLAYQNIHQSLPVTQPYEAYIQWLQKQNQEEARNFWKTYLSGLSEAIALRGKSNLDKSGYALQDFNLTQTETFALKNLAAQQSLTLNTVILGLWSLLVYRLVQCHDFVIGLTVSGRSVPVESIEKMTGLFINTLPLRLRIRNEKEKVHALLQRIQADILTINQYTYLSLAEIQSLSSIEGTLFDHLFIFENYPSDHVSSSLALKGNTHFEKTEFPLTVCVIPEEKMTIQFGFNTQFFGLDDVETLFRAFRNIVRVYISQPDPQISEIYLLSNEEKHHLLNNFQTEPLQYKPQSVHELFEQQVLETPEATAIICDNEFLTFSELNKKANQLARKLRKHGVGLEDRVGICLKRSPELIISILGVLKAGAAYVPIDPYFPHERLQFLLQDSNVKKVLTQSEFLTQLKSWEDKVFFVDKRWQVLEQESSSNPCFLFHSSQMVYLIYTSGSTGKPKGVIISHLNFVHSLKARFSAYSQPVKVFLLSLGITFDTCSAGIFWPLLQGGCLVLFPDAIRHIQDKLIDYLSKFHVSHIMCVPSLYSVLLEQLSYEKNLSLKQVTLGGETLERNLVERHKKQLENVELFNEYGPTEATIWSTFKQVYPSNNNFPISIGKPILHMQAFVLNPSLHLMPCEFKGEIYLGGTGIARGYFNRSALTAEYFLPNFLINQLEGARLYKTGDLAKQSSNGELQYEGRIDNQIKLRGYRVELEEIEQFINQRNDVICSTVIVNEEINTKDSLMAYVVPQDKITEGGKGEQFIEHLREYLATQLPSYMVPNYFELLKEMPLTPNGKIDRKRLPKSHQSSQKIDMLPVTYLEEELIHIWKELLGKKQISRIDHFFQIGGHSLLATKLIGKLQQRLKVELLLSDVFDHPRVSSLAKKIEEIQKKPRYPELVPLTEAQRNHGVPLSYGQYRLWFIDQFIQEKGLYNIALPLHLHGSIDQDAFNQAFNFILNRHEILRTKIQSIRGTPLQYSSSIAPVWIEFENALNFMEIQLAITEEANRPFDLQKPPLVRAKVWTVKKVSKHSSGYDCETIVLFSFHHIVSDEWSLSIFMDEFSRSYHAFKQHLSPVLPSLPIQYMDFSIWQRKWLEDGVISQQLQFWKGNLDNIPEEISLPYDKKRPLQSSYQGASVHCSLDSALIEEIYKKCEELEITPFAFLLGAFQVLLFKYSGQKNIVIGTPVSNRQYPNTQNLIGFFINTLAINTKVNGIQNFETLLKQIQQNLIKAFEHQDIPFEQIVDNLEMDRLSDRHPIFQSMFIFHNDNVPVFHLDGIKACPLETQVYMSKFDLTLSTTLLSDQFEVSIEYAKDLFEESTILRMAKHFEALVRSIIQQPKKPIRAINMLSEEENQILREWNAVK